MAIPNNTIAVRRADFLLLVSPEDVKVVTMCDANIQDTIIIPAIQLAQDKYVEVVLGATLFGKLMTEWITANKNPNLLPDAVTTTDGIDYKTLYEAVYKALCWWSITELVVPISYKLSEIGAVNNSTDYTNSSNLESVQFTELRYRKNAELYQEKLLAYIKEAFRNDSDVQLESREEGGYDSGIYFPYQRKRCKYGFL